MNYTIGIIEGDWIIDIEHLPYSKEDKQFAIPYKQIATICVGSYRKWEIPNSLIVANDKTQNHIQFYLQDDINPGCNTEDDLCQLFYVGSHKGVLYSIIVDIRIESN